MNVSGAMPSFCRRDSFSSIQVRVPFAEVLNNSHRRRLNNIPQSQKYSLDGIENSGGYRYDSRYCDSRYGDSGVGGAAQHLLNHVGNRTTYMQHKYIHPDVEHDRREKITINVSGERYQTFVETLDRFPETLLGNSIKREEFYDDVEDEYFFDRDRTAFNAILYYYQSYGQLYCPLTVPMTILVEEAKFFQLGNDALKQVLDLDSCDNSKLMPKNKWKRKIWCLFEHPETSRAAHALTLFSVLMILFSVTILCVETLPEFRVVENDSSTSQKTSYNLLAEMTVNNKTIYMTNYTGASVSVVDQSRTYCQCSCRCKVNKESFEMHDGDDKSHEENKWDDLFHNCEMVMVIWFTFEFIVRALTAPDKKKFFKGFLNIIDVVSILPFYITAALNRHDGFGIENFRVIRLVRVFRIFKLSRHSKGLQILGFTLRASMRELGLMVFFLAIGVILFSSAVYYLESNNFTSIPDAFWWAIITMCTVGYGDKVPKTFWGKLVGSACSVCGVLSIALPVPVIVSNFDYFYNRERTKKMHESFLDESSKPTSLDVAPINHPNTDIPQINHEQGNDKQGNYDHRNGNNHKESPDSQLIAHVMSAASSKATSPVLRAASSKTTSPVLQLNGSLRSATDSRNDEIHRQATLKGLEKKHRKLSQRLSEASLHSPHRKNDSMHNGFDRESFM